jgi:hypothetical protein
VSLKTHLWLSAGVKEYSHINMNEMDEHVARMGDRRDAYRVLVRET